MIEQVVFRLNSTPFWVRLALVHALAVLVGTIFLEAKVPLPWMLGGLAAGGLLAASGVRQITHVNGRRMGQLIVGAAIGLYFTPSTAAATLAHLGVMILTAVITLLLGCLLAWLLARSAGLDAATAFFASVPGSPVEMSLLAERHGGAAMPVALSQILRIILLVVLVPPALTWSGAAGLDLAGVAQHGFEPVGLAVLLALAAVAALAAERLRISNPWFLGPILASGSLAALEIEPSSVPKLVLSAAQVLLGCSLGAMLQREFLFRSRRFLKNALIGTVLLVGGCVALADAIGSAVGIGVPTLILALVPGGVTEMCITANVLHLGAPIVAAFHLLRIFLLILVTPWVFEGLRFVQRRVGHAPQAGD
jgi:membrane AbrB-like protein